MGMPQEFRNVDFYGSETFRRGHVGRLASLIDAGPAGHVSQPSETRTDQQ